MLQTAGRHVIVVSVPTWTSAPPAVRYRRRTYVLDRAWQRAGVLVYAEAA